MRPISQEETNKNNTLRVETASDFLKTELQKKYIQKNSLVINIQLPKNHELKEGQEIYLEKQPLEYYIQNALTPILKFTNNKGIVVAQKNNEPNLTHNMLKAVFNNYELIIRLETIDTPDTYTLK